MSNKSNKPAPRSPHRTPSGRASRARVIEATAPSTCFSELYFEGNGDGDGEGIATATFVKDGSTYTYAIDRATFREWADDSLGKFFNEQIR